MAGDNEEQALLLTPVWAVATTCLIFIFFGTSAKQLIQRVSRLLKEHNKNALYDAMEELKTVLMELGFMSLVLSVAQNPISKICITNAAAHGMHTCTATEELPPSSDYCSSKGKTSFISVEAMHELHIFIFVLAVMQIVLSLTHMGLGMLKMKRWASWEREARNVDPERLTSRYATENTFLWIRCFFRQFFPSMTRDHYLALRQATDDSANYRKHVQQALENDFKALIGINPIMYMLVVMFMFGNLLGGRFFIWPSFPFLPLIGMLIVGAKVETIVAKMAPGHLDSSTINHLFWFNRPQLSAEISPFNPVYGKYSFKTPLIYPSLYGSYGNMESITVLLYRMTLVYNQACSSGDSTSPRQLQHSALVTQVGSKYKTTVGSKYKTTMPEEPPVDIPTAMAERSTGASTSQGSPTPPTCTEVVHSDEIVEIRCEGPADASTSHQSVSMPPHLISDTPPEDVEVEITIEEDVEVEITLEEEDVEVPPVLEETGEDANSGTKPDAQSVSPGDQPDAMPPHLISDTPPEDAEVEIAVEEEDVEVPPVPEETGEDASSRTRPDAQSVSPGDQPNAQSVDPVDSALSEV